MGQNDLERRGRIFHRWLGLSAVGFLLLSVGTGLLWANARFLYWEDGYKEKLHPLPAVSLQKATLSSQQIIERVLSVAGNQSSVEQIALKSDFGVLIYEVRTRAGKAKQVWLVDAITGEPLSPISDKLAVAIAGQYVREEAPLKAVTVEAYTPRKKHTAVQAVRVQFEDADETQIILDRYTGEILEDEGRWRRLHFTVMQLHQLNFFGFEKTLLNIPGILLLLMGITGLMVWGVQWKRNRRARKVTYPHARNGSDKVLKTAPDHP